jgi:DNA processing protein
MILTDEQRLDWLRLIRSENVGPRTFRALVNQYGGAAAALEALPDLARRGGRLLLKVCSRAEAEKEMAAALRLGVRFVAMGEPDYPKPCRPSTPRLRWSRFAATLRCWPSLPLPS